MKKKVQSIGIVTKLEVCFPIYDPGTGKCWWRLTWAGVQTNADVLIHRGSTINHEAPSLAVAAREARAEYMKFKKSLIAQGYRF